MEFGPLVQANSPIVREMQQAQGFDPGRRPRTLLTTFFISA